MISPKRSNPLVSLFALSILSLAIAANPTQAQTPFAKIETVEATSDGLSRSFFGRVVARQTVDYAFQVGGQIFELPVDEGQELTKDDLIAQLDLEPFELGLAQREAELTQATRDLERLEQLVGSTVSQVTVDDAATAAQLAEIAVSNAERDLRLATLRAPFDAVVASRNVPNFSTISAGTPVVRLHDMSDLRVEIEVPEILFQRAGEDPDVRLTAEFPSSTKRYDLEFREATAETTAVGQAFTITLGMTPPDDLLVLPGSSVTVHAAFEDAAPEITVPPSALVFDSDGAAALFVFTATSGDEGTVTRTPVTIGATKYGRIDVIDGIEEGMEIVASGAALLADGQTVRRFAGFEE